MILRTTDGGRHWSSLGGLPYVPNAAGIAFPTGHRGYLTYGGSNADTMWTTEDGGTTWSPLWPAPAPTAVLGAAHGAAFGVIEAQGGHRAMHSTDGGLTWSPWPAAPPGITVLGTSDGRTIYVVNRTAGSPGLELSTDGGATWQPRTLPTSGAPAEMSFPSTTVGFSLGGHENIYRTEDGGGSWTRTGALPAGEGYLNLDFVSATEAWTITRAGLERTDNAGAHWQVVGTAATGQSLVSVTFSGPQHGAMLEEGDTSGLLTTSDGGVHWTLRPLPTGQGSALNPLGVGPNALSSAGAGHLLISTPIGLLVSTDDGAHWVWSGQLSVPCMPGFGRCHARHTPSLRV